MFCKLGQAVQESIQVIINLRRCSDNLFHSFYLLNCYYILPINGHELVNFLAASVGSKATAVISLPKSGSRKMVCLIPVKIALVINLINASSSATVNNAK